MDKPCIPSGAFTGAGELTTFYTDDSGAARSLVLSNMAWLLAGPQHASAPVLMVDWDLASPGLDQMFGSAGERPGLLEFFEACRDQLAGMAPAGGPDADPDVDPDNIARQVLAAVDWQDYVEHVDTSRPLYLMRAGRVDASYGVRAARFDWEALYRACPALLRQLRMQLCRTFRHVFIDAGCGRSAALSVCTALLPDKIVGLFTPAQRSLDGVCGVMQRAIAYRCSHEDEQRPLLLYPLPCGPAGAGEAWRRGDAQLHLPGYQRVLEALMEASYSREQLSLENYFNKVRLPSLDAETGVAASDHTAHPDRLAAGRTLLALLDWFEDGYFPWQSEADVAQLRAISAGRGARVAVDAAPPAPATGQAQFPALRPLALHGDWQPCGADQAGVSPRQRYGRLAGLYTR